MNSTNNNEIIFEDISSSSPNSVKTVIKKTTDTAKYAADIYGNSAFKNIDKVIKTISFAVAIALFLVFLAGAVIVFLIDKALIFLCALILVIGAAISLISLFLIYGLGLVISQNKEILKRLRRLQ